MPDVTVNNPKVQIDLANGETTTVPNGARFHVRLIAKPGDVQVRLNGEIVIENDNVGDVVTLETDLFEGDTVKTGNGITFLRGYRVD